MNDYYEELKNLEASQIIRVLQQACEKGDLDKIRYLLVTHQEQNLKEYDMLYRNIQDADLYRFINDCLIFACKNNHLELVKYFLTSPELKKKANIQPKNRTPLSYACGEGHLEIVKYLLTSPDLPVRANIHADNEAALKSACLDGNIDIVKYLFSSQKLASDQNIIKNNEEVLRVLFKNVKKNSGKMEIAHYFIFELNIERTKIIDEILVQEPNAEIENWFKIRDLNQKLGKELNSEKEKITASKKPKL